MRLFSLVKLADEATMIVTCSDGSGAACIKCADGSGEFHFITEWLNCNAACADGSDECNMTVSV